MLWWQSLVAAELSKADCERCSVAAEPINFTGTTATDMPLKAEPLTSAEPTKVETYDG